MGAHEGVNLGRLWPDLEFPTTLLGGVLVADVIDNDRR